MRDACRATSNLEVRDQREQEAGPGRRKRKEPGDLRVEDVGVGS